MYYIDYINVEFMTLLCRSNLIGNKLSFYFSVQLFYILLCLYVLMAYFPFCILFEAALFALNVVLRLSGKKYCKIYVAMKK